VYRERDWQLAGIRAGLPQVYPETYESFVAQMLNLDLLGGNAFEKGCSHGTGDHCPHAFPGSDQTADVPVRERRPAARSWHTSAGGRAARR
jgi:hypothetical protein